MPAWSTNCHGQSGERAEQPDHLLGVARFPFAIFYVETTDEIDVWRVLHVRRDPPRVVDDPR